MEIINHIKNTIEKSSGISLAFVGDNAAYLKKKALEIAELFSSNRLENLLLIEGKNITIQNVRTLQEFLSFAPEAGKKFVLLINAERLLPEAENALLKILEEPPEYSVIILTTTSWNSLYPTVRSRLQRFNIRREIETISSEIKDPFLKKLIILNPEFKGRIVNNDYKVLSIDELLEEDDLLSIYISLYKLIEDSVNQKDVLLKLTKILSTKKEFDFLVILARVCLWVLENNLGIEHIPYELALEIDRIVSSKIGNYNYELTYHFLLLSLEKAFSEKSK
ncbi:hypothetical protein JYK00_09585 [Thermosipho ferrireducens]|uniref:Tm0771-like C-terminal domain-containing protein n=1 Tax=Thermosipho ferrireducens TaxID=2571116 RepID=A0ABX7S9C1_9BACT|nr:hypothetical protein [Thermosipho ferrireducens]QTA37951.1 hypothetical protein JYK00_09585 [Thermosipho ferrireducens]